MAVPWVGRCFQTGRLTPDAIDNQLRQDLVDFLLVESMQIPYEQRKDVKNYIQSEIDKENQD